MSKVYITDNYKQVINNKICNIRKIGMSNDAEHRLTLGQTFIPVLITGYVEVKSRNVKKRKLESIIHEAFAKHHLETESARELFKGISDNCIISTLHKLKKTTVHDLKFSHKQTQSSRAAQKRSYQ